MVSHSPIVRAADADSDPASDELKTCHPTISRAADSDSDELNQEQIVVTEEDEHGDKLYIKQSHLREILFSPPGKYEAEGLPDFLANGYKHFRFKNEEGKEEIYLFLSSFEKKYKSRFPKGEKLISCRVIGLFPRTPAWGVEVDLPSKNKSSTKKHTHGRHRSERIKK